MHIGSEIPLHKREGIVAVALVDPLDWVWASQFRWHWMNGYAARSQRAGGPKGRPERVFLHREIMGHKKTDRYTVIDHINGDPMDCRKANLRVGDYAMNAQNRASRVGSSSKYKGVYWVRSVKKWKAASQMGGKYVLIGYFADEDEAGAAAAEYFSAHSPYQRQPQAVTASGPGTSGILDPVQPELGPDEVVSDTQPL